MAWQRSSPWSKGCWGEGKIECDRVDQDEIGRRVELLHCSLHSQTGRLVDVDGIDGGIVDGCDSPGDGAIPDLLSQNFAALGIQLFAVIQATNGGIRRENHGAGNNGAEQGTATHFVRAGDETIAARAEFILMRAEALPVPVFF